MARGELCSAALVTHLVRVRVRLRLRVSLSLSLRLRVGTHHIDRAAHVDVNKVDVHMLLDKLRRLAQVLGARAGELYAEDILVRVRVRVGVRVRVRVRVGVRVRVRVTSASG